MKHLIILLALMFATTGISAAEPSGNPRPAKEAKSAAEKTHWITQSSGVRHNSKCRYYQKSKGRACTKDEGRACKICGG